RDLERTIGRLAVGSGNARDLQALAVALQQIPSLRQILTRLDGFLKEDMHRGVLPTLNEAANGTKSGEPLLHLIQQRINEMPQVVELISRAIVDEPPLGLKEGGLIRDGFDAGLDELRAATRGGKDWIAKLQQDEIQRTGIYSLKVRFNSVFGYYIEVIKSNMDKVTVHFISTNTL